MVASARRRCRGESVNRETGETQARGSYQTVWLDPRLRLSGLGVTAGGGTAVRPRPSTQIGREK